MNYSRRTRARSRKFACFSAIKCTVLTLHRLQWQISLQTLLILKLKQSLPFHIPEAWKRYPNRAAPLRIDNYREYLPPPPPTQGGTQIKVDYNGVEPISLNGLTHFAKLLTAAYFDSQLTCFCCESLSPICQNNLMKRIPSDNVSNVDLPRLE